MKVNFAIPVLVVLTMLLAGCAGSDVEFKNIQLGKFYTFDSGTKILGVPGIGNVQFSITSIQRSNEKTIGISGSGLPNRETIFFRCDAADNKLVKLTGKDGQIYDLTFGPAAYSVCTNNNKISLKVTMGTKDSGQDTTALAAAPTTDNCGGEQQPCCVLDKSVSFNYCKKGGESSCALKDENVDFTSGDSNTHAIADTICCTKPNNYGKDGNEKLDADYRSCLGEVGQTPETVLVVNSKSLEEAQPSATDLTIKFNIDADKLNSVLSGKSAYVSDGVKYFAEKCKNNVCTAPGLFLVDRDTVVKSGTDSSGIVEFDFKWFTGTTLTFDLKAKKPCTTVNAACVANLNQEYAAANDKGKEVVLKFLGQYSVNGEYKAVVFVSLPGEEFPSAFDHVNENTAAALAKTGNPAILSEQWLEVGGEPFFVKDFGDYLKPTVIGPKVSVGGVDTVEKSMEFEQLRALSTYVDNKPSQSPGQVIGAHSLKEGEELKLVSSTDKPYSVKLIQFVEPIIAHYVIDSNSDAIGNLPGDELLKLAEISSTSQIILQRTFDKSRHTLTVGEAGFTVSTTAGSYTVVLDSISADKSTVSITVTRPARAQIKVESITVGKKKSFAGLADGSELQGLPDGQKLVFIGVVSGKTFSVKFNQYDSSGMLLNQNVVLKQGEYLSLAAHDGAYSLRLTSYSSDYKFGVDVFYPLSQKEVVAKYDLRVDGSTPANALPDDAVLTLTSFDKTAGLTLSVDGKSYAIAKLNGVLNVPDEKNSKFSVKWISTATNGYNDFVSAKLEITTPLETPVQTETAVTEPAAPAEPVAGVGDSTADTATTDQTVPPE